MSENYELFFECSDDLILGKIFSYANIPEHYREGDQIANLNTDDVMDALNKADAAVDEDTFDEGMPGMSGTFYKVYVKDETVFRAKLTDVLLKLL